MSSQRKFDNGKAKQLMAGQGRKQHWLASECRVSRNYINLILNGWRAPSAATWKLMAMALGVSEDVLTKAATKAKAS